MKNNEQKDKANFVMPQRLFRYLVCRHDIQIGSEILFIGNSGSHLAEDLADLGCQIVHLRDLKNYSRERRFEFVLSDSVPGLLPQSDCSQTRLSLPECLSLLKPSGRLIWVEPRPSDSPSRLTHPILNSNQESFSNIPVSSSSKEFHSEFKWFRCWIRRHQEQKTESFSYKVTSLKIPDDFITTSEWLFYFENQLAQTE